ncbi:hypothetical protein BKK47_03390 [Rodentibacter mrazii]|uniref:Uncharacterized protein n=1 Tax=Rodentibacter mrazii TaxID=1908257 RepID=A0A1V3IHK8_9PAST|nr:MULTISPECIES: hypothetical protein [Pasteurellaceae]MCR1837595.1 hypothetical protein [Pasteurella caecimuris]MCU0107981.1 hypothetical protein [Pasteurella caecimuris]OOF40662.1 hypothetical protein BKK47_03390 [Rodentibacter mrazii]
MRKMVAEFHFKNNESVAFLTNLHLNKQDDFKVPRIVEDDALEKYDLLGDLLDAEIINFLLYLKNNNPDKFEKVLERFNQNVIDNILQE